MMTPAEIAALRSLAERATPGEWRVDGEDLRALVRGADLTIVAVRHRLHAELHEANAALIVAAVNALPRLLALAERVGEMETALGMLANEVLGSLPLMEAEARQAIGNTNYALLIQRAEEARAALRAGGVR